MSDNERVIVVDHPLMQHKISILRHKDTPMSKFRELVHETSTLLFYEATRTLSPEPIEVETPLEKMTGSRIADDKIVVVPILRAGLGMVSGLQAIVPTVKVGHLGLYRDHKTLQPVEYCCILPENLADKHVYILDPMLATGGSAAAAVRILKEKGANDITLLCLIAAPEGIQKLAAEHPDVTIVTGAVDNRLDENAYIRPGLGDAGDRLFGTL